jgi:hypothetical protein
VALPAPALGAAQVMSMAARPASVVPLTITRVAQQDGQLVAHGLLGSHAFTAPLTLTARPNAADPICPILDLRIGPIHLNLLGLKVDTSPICLSIKGDSGAGNLLGNLLCDVANLLNQGQSLSTILGGLTSSQLHTLTSGITSMLNGVLRDVTTPSLHLPGQHASVTGPECSILHLSLGPVNLNLLGLKVHLDNCSGGPVKVNVTAEPGAGNLLGNLLCDLAHLLDGHPSLAALDKLFSRIGREIQTLI